jgi:predicted PurR-regulated permease PerM
MAVNESSIARILRPAIIFTFAAIFIWKTISVLLLIFAGVVFAVFLSKSSQLFSRHSGLGHHISLALVAGLVAALVAGSCWFFAQSVIGQFDQLSQLLTSDISKLQQRLPDFIWTRLAGSLDPSRFSGTFRELFGIFSSAIAVAGAIVVIIFFGLYMAAEPEVYAKGLILLVPQARRSRVRELLRLLADVLWAWLLGRLFAMVVVGAATTVGLWGLGIPVPIALGLLAAGLAFIPYVGAIASAVPSLLLAFTLGIWHALYVLLLYVGIHILEGYILIPLVQKRAAHVPPAVTLAGQLIMGVIAGVLGLLLAMPLTAILIPTLRLLYVEDILNGRAASGR